jgi:hypothetical protein
LGKQHAATNTIQRIGFTTSTPKKSFPLSVTTTHPCATAVATIIVSSALRERPLALPYDISRAQISAAV